MRRERFVKALVAAAVSLFIVVQPCAAASRRTPVAPCDWAVEEVFVSPGKIGDKDRKALDKLLDALVAAIGAAAAEVKAIKTAIDKLGPGGDVVDVDVIYVCTDKAGKITRIRKTLDGNTEALHWAAKTNLLTGVAKDDNEREKKKILDHNKPKVSCCKPPPAAPNGGIKSGLDLKNFSTPYGDLILHYPADISAGDTISGTVTVEPAGDTPAQKEANSGQLDGYVVEVEHQRPTAGHPWIKWLVAGAVVSYVVLDKQGRKVGEGSIPVAPNPSGSVDPSPKPSDFHLPEIGQAGRAVAIGGSFGGDIGKTRATLGGQPVNIIAESPRAAFLQLPADVVGVRDLALSERDVTMHTPFRCIGVGLSAGKTSLRRGETTTMTVRVSGLADLAHDIWLKLTNTSTNVLHVGGGDVQTINVRPSDVREGLFTKVFDLTGASPGGFVINVNLITDQIAGDEDGLGGAPVPSATMRKFERQVTEAYKKRREAEKAAADAAAKRAAANALKKAADEAKKAADRAEKNDAPLKADERKKSDDAAKAAADAEKAAQTAENDAKQKGADSAQADTDRDKTGAGISDDAKNDIYKKLAGEAEAAANEAQGEADHYKEINDADKKAGRDPDPKNVDYEERKAAEAAEKKAEADAMKKLIKP
ncbi:MAG: hypothetical protein JO314_02880 [Acidobacteria bacterium]|nr:hypothetical protein [Acidobacteriota bacterium]